ncbi:MAG: hypothetical protein JWL84_6084 [Rhodospirillales bacterium]|nr:hypothetical protein [Rhodospirillales bacterium]
MHATIFAAALMLAPAIAMAQSSTAQTPTPSTAGAAIVVPPSDQSVRQTQRSPNDPANDRSGGVPSDQSVGSGSSRDTRSPTPGTRDGTTVVSPPVTRDGKPAGTPETGKP